MLSMPKPSESQSISAVAWWPLLWFAVLLLLSLLWLLASSSETLQSQHVEFCECCSGHIRLMLWQAKGTFKVA